MKRDQDDDLQTLRRMLPVPAERDFPAGRRHQREEHLMNSLLNPAPRPDRRKRLALRVALPVGLAASATGVVVTALSGGPVNQPQASSPSSTVTGAPSTSPQSLGRITTAAYTVQREDNDIVKLTITDRAGKPDLTKLQDDLDRLGVPSRVFAGDPECHPKPQPEPSQSPGATPSGSPQPDDSPRQHSADDRPILEHQTWTISMEDGKPVLYVRPSHVPAGQKIMIGFPLAATDPANALSVIMGDMIEGNAPYCLPAPPVGALQPPRTP
ncbi:hypothetical protein [Streptomyces sp. NBC_00233]|uniref:hypothetical protein n=1 Tax=Streptomyces sp. NBC_00233 TaxID=2975686 RepID=UPI00224F952D|nr:hypothetical protein [Streptomyces sp. NBC_00233]MCX5233093.1 hypothetical protein [Streptomyces sp. NBC_00233]